MYVLVGNVRVCFFYFSGETKCGGVTITEIGTDDEEDVVVKKTEEEKEKE